MKGLQLVLGCGLFALAAAAAAQVSLPSDSTSSFIKKAFNPVETASIKHLMRTEDISLLKDLFGQQLSLVDKNLDRAATLQPREYEKGKEISRSECEAYEALISKNYPLHSYQGLDGFLRKGVNVCSPEYHSPSPSIVYSSFKYSFSNKAVDNNFGIRANAVLTVEYDHKAYRNKQNVVYHFTKQYLIDNTYRMLELTWDDKRSDSATSSDTRVSTLDNEGNVYRHHDGYVHFIPAQGEFASGGRDTNGNYQRNGYTMPYDSPWEVYEAAVDNGYPLYKVNGKVVSWLQQTINFEQYTNLLNNNVCEHGYVASTDNNYILLLREFGNQYCYQ